MAFIKNYYNEFTDLMDKTGGKFCMQEYILEKKIKKIFFTTRLFVRKFVIYKTQYRFFYQGRKVGLK